jgi:hypothetical protein
MDIFYVILMLAGMFRLSCLYVFDNNLGSYMIYNLTVIFVLSYLSTYEHVDHPFCIHVNIYDAMLQLFIIIHVITMQSLFFGIKLCRKLSKSLTTIATILLDGGGTSHARAWPVAAISMYRHADYAGDAWMPISVGATVPVPSQHGGTLYHTPKFLFRVVIRKH